VYPEGDAVGLLVRGLEVLIQVRGAEVELPALAVVAPLAEGEWIDVGRHGGRRWVAAALAEGVAPPLGLALVSARGLFDRLRPEELAMVGQALALVEFETMHRRCGRCGAPTEPVPGERARRCSVGHGTFHPRIAPAVIALVVRGDEMLLARNVLFPPGRFSAVAGFAETGESLEDTVRREVREEVGVEVGELAYFGSQPWPFGRSLMIGFFGRWAGGDIRVDGVEIVEAAWFTGARLPALPPPVSIARRLIDAFVAGAARWGQPRAPSVDGST
jgi:NAD+ diphosphatase